MKEEYLYFKTAIGSVLALPESLSPSDFTYIDKGRLSSKSEDYILNVWGSRGADKLTPYDVCKEFHKDLDIDVCIANGYETWVSSLSNGGIQNFSIIDEKTGDRVRYTACWAVQRDSKIIDFKDRNFSGYFPNSEKTTGSCSGLPYGYEEKKEGDNKRTPGDWGDTIKFSIALPLNK